MLTTGLMMVILVFFRMTGMLMIIPIFGSRNVPTQIRLGLSIFLTLAAVPIASTAEVANSITFDLFVYYMLMEFVTGFAIGLVTTMLLTFVYVAGTIIDRNIGFAMVSVMNATGDQQLPVTANLFYLLALMVFMTTDTHQMVIRAVMNSFEMIPLGTATFDFRIVYQLVHLLSSATEIGFQLAAPFIIMVFISNVILGLLSKAMPGMNIFILGLPFKIFFGLALMSIMIPYLANIFLDLFLWLSEYIMYFPGVMR